jgi:hypothetical protein
MAEQLISAADSSVRAVGEAKELAERCTMTASVGGHR